MTTDRRQEVAAAMRFLKLLYKYWIKFGKILGFITTTIILFVTYVVMIGPISLVLRVLGKDMLDRRLRHAVTFWSPRQPADTSLEMSRHQF